MRTLVRIHIPNATGNAARQDGSLPRTIGEMLERLKPEAAYFFPDEGMRSALLVVDLEKASDIPTIAEPLFEKLGAEVTLTPVMTADDLEKGLAAIPR